MCTHTSHVLFHMSCLLLYTTQYSKSTPGIHKLPPYQGDAGGLFDADGAGVLGADTLVSGGGEEP